MKTNIPSPKMIGINEYQRRYRAGIKRKTSIRRWTGLSIKAIGRTAYRAAYRKLKNKIKTKITGRL